MSPNRVRFIPRRRLTSEEAASRQESLTGKPETHDILDWSHRPDPFQNIRPSAIEAFLDKLTIWAKPPLPDLEVQKLTRLCGGPVKITPIKWPLFFQGSQFPQRIDLHQPSRAALTLLIQRTGIHMTRVELALDWIFADAETLAEAHKLLHRHRLIKFQRRSGQFYSNNPDLTWYAKRRSYRNGRVAPFNYATYSDFPCKTTGEVHCLHQEFRIQGPALKRLELFSPPDLLTFDVHCFFINICAFIHSTNPGLV